MNKLTSIIPLLALSVVFLFAGTGMAQPGGSEGEGRGGDRRGDRGRMNFQDMTEEQRQQMMERFQERRKQMEQQQNERLRERLELSEEEFDVLEPMIAKVRQLSGESMIAGRGFFGGRGGGGGFNPFASEMSPQGQAVTDTTSALRETLEDEAATSDQIKEKLEALRKARRAMQDALRQAREELRDFLTPKQEAQLVVSGMLD